MISKIENFIKREIIKTSYYEVKVPFLFFLMFLIFGILVDQMSFSNFLLLVTFFALAWYSFETRQLKNVARTTNELQQSPFFVLIYDEDKNLSLKNEGKGIAYNIAIDSIKIGNENFEFGLLSKWYYCGSGEQREIPITISTDDGSRRYDVNVDELLCKALHKSIKIVTLIIRFNSPLKNNDQQKIILKIPEQPENIEQIKIYNFEENSIEL